MLCVLQAIANAERKPADDQDAADETEQVLLLCWLVSLYEYMRERGLGGSVGWLLCVCVHEGGGGRCMCVLYVLFNLFFCCKLHRLWCLFA